MGTAAVATREQGQKPNRRWRSNLRHGLRSRKLPFEGGDSIEKYRNEYRRAVEDELLSQGREIGVGEATAIAAVAAAYEYAMKAGFWLANHHDAMNHDQRLAYALAEHRGLSEAARLLRQLGVFRDPTTHDPWKNLHTINPTSAKQPVRHNGVHAGDTCDASDVGDSPAASAENATATPTEALQ